MMDFDIFGLQVTMTGVTHISTSFNGKFQESKEQRFNTELGKYAYLWSDRRKLYPEKEINKAWSKKNYSLLS